MALSKRAVFFTLSSILFVTAMLLLFTADFTGGPVDTRSSAIAVANAYRQKLETTYLPTIVRHYSYQTLHALTTDAYTEGAGVYLRMPSDFQSAILYANYSGNPSAVRTLSGFTTLSTALDAFENVSIATGNNITLVLNGISVRQTGTFTGLAEANISYNLTSPDGTVRFSRDLEVSTTFDLYYLPDLFYNQQARASFNENTTLQYIDIQGNYEFNESNVNRSLYSVNNDSPSYFGRITNSLSASAYGIETTIPPTVAIIDNRTSIDWQYFQNLRYNCVYRNATTMDPDVQLELATLGAYRINATLAASIGGAACPPYIGW